MIIAYLILSNFQTVLYTSLGGASYLNTNTNNAENTYRPYVYTNDCFGALCPWWLPAKDTTSEKELQSNENIDCVGDCVEVIGAQSGSKDNNRKESNDDNGAFPKTRYQVEGKPSGISVLQARKSFLKQQFRSKGNEEIMIIIE